LQFRTLPPTTAARRCPSGTPARRIASEISRPATEHDCRAAIERRAVVQVAETKTTAAGLYPPQPVGGRPRSPSLRDARLGYALLFLMHLLHTIA